MTKEETIKLIDDRMCFGRGKWSEHHQPVIDEYWQAGEMAIKALDAEPHWIPVEQALPEENYLDDGYVEPSQPVLVYMSYHCYKVSRYWGHRKTKSTSGYVIPDWMDLEAHDGDNVLAWQPLPEPYKGVTE